MTIDEVIEALPTDGWHLVGMKIRRACGPGEQCPISSLGDRWVGRYAEVADRLGINPDDRALIVTAADVSAEILQKRITYNIDIDRTVNTVNVERRKAALAIRRRLINKLFPNVEGDL
jgi:hypothetical protein